MRRDSKTARVIIIGLVITNLGPRAVRAAQETIDTVAALADLAGFSAQDSATAPLVEEQKPQLSNKDHDPNDPSGGDPSGGDPSGGDPSGGDPSGGDPSGGDPSGGDPSGGDPSGGDPSGGDPSGGDPSGGDPSGGDPSGGDPSGGDPSGGDPSGGDPSGGDPSGGDPSGGDPSGGDPSGGDPSGGDPSGGDPSGGDPSGGDPSGGDPSGAPPDFVTQGRFDTSEGDQNTFVADIDATDGDGGGFDENVTYEIDGVLPVDPNYPDPFTIDPDDGELRTRQDAFVDRDIAHEYVVTIRAMDEDGATDKEYVIDVHKADDPPSTPAPIGPDDEVVDTRKPTFSWNAVSGANKYDLWTIDALERSVQKTFSQDGANCQFNPVCYAMPSTALAQGMASWWVRSRNQVGDSQWSDALNFSVEASEPPDQPEMLGPEGSVTTTQPELLWTARATSTDYLVRVQYRDIQTAKKKTFEQYFAAGEVGCGDGSAECSLVMPFEIGDGKTKAKVKAVNDFGESKWSKTLTFKIEADKALQGDKLGDSAGNAVQIVAWQPDDWSQWLSTQSDNPAIWDIQAALSAGCQVSQKASGNSAFVAVWDCATPIVFAVTDGNIAWSQPASGEHMSLTAKAVVVAGDFRVEHLDRLDGSPIAPPVRLDVRPGNLVSDHFGATYVSDEFGISVVRPGRIAWTWVGSQPMSFGPVFGPDGNVYLGTVDGFLIALNRRGDELMVERVSSGSVADIRFEGVGQLNVFDVQGNQYKVSLPEIEDDF